MASMKMYEGGCYEADGKWFQDPLHFQVLDLEIFVSLCY